MRTGILPILLFFLIIPLVFPQGAYALPIPPRPSAATSSNATVNTTATSLCVITDNGHPAKENPPSDCITLGASASSDYALKMVLAITNKTTNCADSSYAADGHGIPVTFTSTKFKALSKGDPCLSPISDTADNLPNWNEIKTSSAYIGYWGSGGALQCVGFANAALKGGNQVALQDPNTGVEQNAQEYQFHTTDYPAYQWFDNTPANMNNLKAGDAVIFSGGQFGHIAIVGKVFPPSGGIERFIVLEGNGLGNGDVDAFPYDTGIYAKGLSLVGWFHKK